MFCQRVPVAGRATRRIYVGQHFQVPTISWNFHSFLAVFCLHPDFSVCMRSALQILPTAMCMRFSPRLSGWGPLMAKHQRGIAYGATTGGCWMRSSKWGVTWVDLLCNHCQGQLLCENTSTNKDEHDELESRVSSSRASVLDAICRTIHEKNSDAFPIPKFGPWWKHHLRAYTAAFADLVARVTQSPLKDCRGKVEIVWVSGLAEGIHFILYAQM